MNKTKKWLIRIGIFIILLISGLGIFWRMSVYDAMPEAKAACISNEKVIYEHNSWLVFSPTAAKTDKGFIMYPGGLVQPEAYAPLAKAIATKGYLVVIVPMPLDLAVLSSDQADDVIKAYPKIKSWAIGGHSLGGVMASEYARKNPDKIHGLAFFAAYPISGRDLRNYNLRVISLYGTNDGFVSPTQIEASRLQLPPDTLVKSIEGGNHSQMGWYGLQKGDKPAGISREEQQELVTDTVVEMLEAM